MAEALGFIYALIKAIPVVDKAVRALLKYYAEQEKEWFYKEVTKAMLDAVNGDQRKLEEVIGSQRAGKPSEQSGTRWRD
jgi:hypothetical protein